MVQFTDGAPAEGGAVVVSQAHVPHFPALPVTQLNAQPQVPQTYPEDASQLYQGAESQLYPETTLQQYTDVSEPVYQGSSAQFYTDPKSQLYPEGVSQFYPESESSHMYNSTTGLQSQMYCESTPEMFPETTAHVFSDPTSQMYPSLFTAPDQFVPSTDGLQYPAFNSTSTDGDVVGVPSTFTAFGPVDNLPTTRLDGSVVSSELLPEFSNTSSDICVDNRGPFESTDYHNVDNSKPFENFTVAPVDYSATENALQAETRADSLDSLNSKGYASDTSSDIYMNSDYTDTLNSVTSAALLLEVSNYKENTKAPQTEEAGEKVAAEQESESFYTNKAFTDSGVSLKSQYPSENSLSSETIPEEEKAEDEENSNWVPSENSGSCEAEESEVVTDKDTEYVSDTEQVLLDAPDCVESLVHQLAEQHPSDVVQIHVQVLDEPVYQPLTQPILEEEEGWMNSTESLHHYKLLKQGRAGTMFNLHERQSFLNLTAASVTSLGHVCQKALQYVRADMEFGSMMSLGIADSHSMKYPSVLTLGKGGQPPSDMEALQGGLKKKMEPSVASGRHTRNLILVSVLATILLVSINATRNLQSSLNQEGGVGITSLAVSFAFFTLGSLISPVVVQKLGVRGSITFGLVLQLIYVAANLHPVMWLMVPASAGGGVSLAIIWNALSTYIVLLARGESSFRDKLYERVSDKYFGIFCLIYQCNLVVGNLIASLILTFGDSAGEVTAAVLLNNTGLGNSSTANLTGSLVPFELLNTQDYFINETAAEDIISDPSALSAVSDFGLNSSTASLAFDASQETHYHLCGSAFCHHFEINQDASAVSDRTKYLLFGIFMFLIGITILIAVFLLEPLCIRLSTVASNPWQTVRRQVVSLARFSLNIRFLLLLPLLFYSSMQFSFVCSEVMMAFVTCPVGVWLVGYTMMCYGVSCGFSSYLTQALVHRTGRTFFIGTASFINLGLLLFMRFWQPHPDSLAPLFVITGLFGFADGIWNVNANGLMGSVFPEHYEEAFTGLRVAQGLGGALTMAYAPFLCMAVKIYIMLGAAVLVFAGYLGAEFLIRRDRRRHASIMYEKDIV